VWDGLVVETTDLKKKFNFIQVRISCKKTQVEYLYSKMTQLRWLKSDSKNSTWVFFCEKNIFFVKKIFFLKTQVEKEILKFTSKTYSNFPQTSSVPTQSNSNWVSFSHSSWDFLTSTWVVLVTHFEVFLSNNFYLGDKGVFVTYFAR